MILPLRGEWLCYRNVIKWNVLRGWYFEVLRLQGRVTFVPNHYVQDGPCIRKM